MNRLVMIVLILLLTVTSFAQKQKQSQNQNLNSELETVRREIAALQKLRMEKLEQLERAESSRWNERYQQNEERTLLEAENRDLDSRYSTAANKLNRRREDVLLLKNSADQELEKLDNDRQRTESFVQQVSRAVEEASNDLALDFPFGMAERMAQLNRAASLLERSQPSVADALKLLLQTKNDRMVLTSHQRLLSRSALFGTADERVVWTLQLGSVALIDIDKNSNDAQMLLRTGNLQGARYAWRRDIQAQLRDKLMPLVSTSTDTSVASIPFDVLQNGKVGKAADNELVRSPVQQFMEWFGKGGLIMYPLFATAIIALLLILERLIVLTIRHHRYAFSYHKLIPLIKSSDWENTSLFCKKRCTGLTRAIHEIIKHRNGGRDIAEQHVKQILLAEAPALEQRFSLIATLGAIAPLLGLLGTVSGMITLFQVITEAGTNDARILAGGISEALITTQTGLLIAIPILLLHGFLTERLDDILSHYNETVQEVFNLVFNRKSAKEEIDVL